MLARTLVAAPADEPISTYDVKEQSIIEIVADDTIINGHIIAARQHIENITNRALVTQTWDLFLDHFHAVIEVPKSLLQSVTSITYVDADGSSQTLSSSVYTVDTDTDPGRIYLAYNQSWPTIRAIRHAITIRFIAGYGDADSVPRDIKLAMLLMVAHYYENREATSPVQLNDIPMGVNALLAPYRVAYL